MASKFYNIRTSIKKEDVNAMPLTSFSGKIHIIDKEEQVAPAIEVLINAEVLGFDTESRPTFKKGEGYQISLLQLATKDDVFLFRLNKTSLLEPILELLSSKKVLKVGVAIRDDIKGLKKLRGFKEAGFVEIADIATELGIKNLGLRNLAAICFSKRISKGAKLSNWENDKLKKNQLDYAATDAWIGLEIYQYLNKIVKEKNNA